MTTTTLERELQLPTRLRLAVMRLARRLRQQAEEGATPSMLSALSSVERLGPVSLSELAQIERVQPPSITKVVAGLEEKGLVHRSSDAQDRRVARVQLTAKGKRFIEQNRSRKNAYLARGLNGLTPDELETLNRALDVLDRLLAEAG
ncbi:MAG: MarR family transcriptional regulator [Actinomycetota bacterium]|nr:MarR family transcriptional regulator [Actinomycetota bacterium]